MSGSWETLRQTFRTLRRHPRFALLAILSLGVAIALNTTMYSVLDAMIRPKLLIHRHERLFEAPYFGDYRGRIPIVERNQAIQSTLTFHAGAAGSRRAFDGTTIERGGRLRTIRLVTVTPTFFQVLGVQPSAGRLLTAADVASRPTTVVLSERMWKHLFPDRERFDTASVLVDGEPRTVVGLLPYEADYPGAYTDAWQMATVTALPQMPLELFRLRDDVTPQQAEAQLAALNLRFLERSGDQLPHAGFRFRQWIKPQFQLWGFHLALTSAVVAVLLIACANLANLQLARGVARTKELATRAAVGASRKALVQHLVAETVWLALGGLLLGALLTAWGMKLVESSVPETLAEYVTRPQMSWRVLLAALGATLFCLVTVGLLPALRLSRVDINSLLKAGSGTGQSRQARRQYAYLVVVEVALALSLLSSAALLGRAAFTLHVDIPDTYRQLATAFVPVRPPPGDLRTRRAWSELLIQRVLRDTTVVSAATVAYRAPRRRAVSVDDPGGSPRAFPTGEPNWGYQEVSPDFLRTMGIPILRGRDFSPGEFAEPQVIVDQHTASYLWPGVNPIGRLVKLDSPQVDAPWMRVVGVARAPLQRWQVRDDQMRSGDPRPALRNVWVLNAHDTAVVQPSPNADRFGGGAFYRVVARSRGDVRRLPVVMRRALSQATPAIGVVMPRTMEDDLGIRRMRERHDFVAGLFGVFAVCALALAALGVYAIIAHGVAQRTREFGVRIAVGASTADIRQLVLRDGNLLALLGIAVGLLITAWSAGLLRAFLFSDYDRYDAPVFAATALALFVVAWLASYVPARRATRIDPVEALRSE